MKKVILTEEQFIKAANELISTIAKDNPNFGFNLVMAYRLLMDKLFECKDSDIENEEVENGDIQKVAKEEQKNRITIREFLNSEDKLAICCWTKDEHEKIDYALVKSGAILGTDFSIEYGSNEAEFRNYVGKKI